MKCIYFLSLLVFVRFIFYFTWFCVHFRIQKCNFPNLHFLLWLIIFGFLTDKLFVPAPIPKLCFFSCKLLPRKQLHLQNVPGCTNSLKHADGETRTRSPRLLKYIYVLVLAQYSILKNPLQTVSHNLSS